MAVKIVDASDSPSDGELAYDPDGSGLGGLVSDLAAIAADIKGRVAQPTRIRNPADARYILEFRSNIGTDEYEQCRKTSERSDTPVRLRNALLLSRTNIGLYKDGTLIENDRGKPVTFRDPSLLAALGVKTAADAVTAFLGSDGHLVTVTEAVVTASGFGGDAETVKDPTEGAN